MSDIWFVVSQTFPNMKKTHVVIILCIITLGSCRDHGYESQNLTIDIQSGFEGDDLQVLIDDVELFRGTAQTNNLLGVCSIGGTTSHTKNLSAGGHKIKVILNGSTTATHSVILNSDLFVGVNYDRQQSTFSFIESGEHFGYD
jgi:hypothetical protein